MTKAEWTNKDALDLQPTCNQLATAEPNKAVPPSLADVYKWERDIALSQLEEYGIGFGEKKRDDLVSVVRCKDCKFKRLYDEGDTKYYYCALEDRPNRNWSVDDMDYCAWGERKGGDDK